MVDLDMAEVARLNISLPDQMLSGITHLVKSGEYSTPSEFVRDAVRREMERREKKEMQKSALLHLKSLAQEAFESGEAQEIEDVESWKATQLARLEERLRNQGDA